MDEPGYSDQADLIAQLFALVTARLEDAAALAAECQARLPREELRRQAQLAQALISDAGTFMASIAALLRHANPG